MRQDRQTWHSVYLILILFLVVLMAIPYLVYLNVIPDIIANTKGIQNASKGWVVWAVKGFYVLMLPLLTSLLFSIRVAKTTKEGEKKIYILFYILLSIIIFIGPIQHQYFLFYNIVFLPLVIFAHVFVSSRAFSEVIGKMEDENVLGFNKKPLDMIGGLKMDVVLNGGGEDYMNIHNIYQGIFVSGGAGSGKSASIVVPALNQWIKQGMSLTIYDFKGDPATLGLFAYNAWKFHKKEYSKKKREYKYPEFEIISFTEIEKSSRPNPFSPKVMKSNLETMEMVKTLLASLNTKFVENPDYWKDSAFAMAHGITERLRRNYPTYCTIPHLAAIGSSIPVADILSWLEKNDFIQTQICVYISAQGSEQTFASMISSFQMEIKKVVDELIFYIMGAEPINQCDLDLNSLENPRIMSISDNKDLHAGVGPVISCIMASVKKTINNQGKHPHFMVIDEYPQLHLEISDLPATGRSNKASILIALQDIKQVEKKYSKVYAEELIANLGTQFYGMSNNDETAKNVSNMFGTVKKKDDSYSFSEDGINFSQRLSNEKIIQDRDVKGQPTGHFVGKIADGDPALFSAQMKYWDPKKEMPYVDTIDFLKLPPRIERIWRQDEEAGRELLDAYIRLEYHRIMSEASQIVYGTIIEEKTDL